MDEAAEPVATADLALRRSCPSLIEFGRPEFEGAMRPLAVVMIDVDAQHAFEVTAVEDQQPVETLDTHSSNAAIAFAFGAIDGNTAPFTRCPTLTRCQISWSRDKLP